MIFEPRSLTVHFSEDDKGLWEILQSLTLKQQQAMIMDALTEYLKEYEVPKAPHAPKEEDLNVPLDLKSLFVLEERYDQGSQGELSLHNAEPTGIPPLKHLFEMLGEEEDEDVIELLMHNRSKGDKEFPFVDGSASAPLEDETVQVSKLGPSSLNKSDSDSHLGKGLNFLLQHVIGEEDDEEVLRFFGSDNSIKKDDKLQACEKLSLDGKG